jgi:hypothetical protein
VLPLTRIDPKYATKAVKLVLKNPDRPSSAPGTASEGQFQVEPDVAHNRLLLWATPAEVAEVREFLERLGESFTTGLAASQMHVVQLRGANAPEVMERLKQVWSQISNAPLVVDDKPTLPSQTSAAETALAKPELPATSPTQTVAPAQAVEPGQSAEPAQPPDPTKTAEPMGERNPGGIPAQFVVQQKPVSPEQAPPVTTEAAQTATATAPTSTQPAPAAAATQAAPPAAEPMPPVHVIAGNDGDMVILSRDPVAAETAKQFVEQIVPAADDVQVIQLKHAQATLVKTQLDALLEHTRASESSELDTEPPLRIEADLRTNRLLIQHATTRQMKLINEMVPQLDRPEQENERLVRQQRIYRAQRKRASEIGEIVKEVYRDLLSTSDKVFAGRESYQPFGYNRALAATTKSPEYQGLLAVGVDDEGNTLILSAPAYLMEEVMRLVLLVDANAGGDRVVVVPLKGGASRTSVGEALKRLLAKPQ